MPRPFVVYWNNLPAPYMVDRFNALADRGNVEFEAWFNDRTFVDRSWDVNEASWRFRYRYLPACRLLGRSLHWPAPLFGRRPDLLFSLYAQPVFVAGWFLAYCRGIKTGFRVLQTSDRWVKRSRAKDVVKRFMFQRANAIETPGEDGCQFAIKYGARPERVYRATHTVDIKSYDPVLMRVNAERGALRKKLGLSGVTFLFVGRLLKDKGLDHLLGAFATVQKQYAGETSLLLVGDGPEEARLRRASLERGLRRVIFAGFQQKSELPRYYAASDVFVFPTLGDPYGIVVDEAMVCSLPVISTSSAGEIRSRVEDGMNGYIVPAEDSMALADRMLRLAGAPVLCARMGKISAAKVADHTPERWASDFERIVKSVLKI